ncbi:MAG TPA: winged helix-turn-helix domain-containing protein [Pyrinomonadaceae bacterium]|nr:winged helix-turn-helix domain-containing protein [Pyrinomonadaceae bacterium]
MSTELTSPAGARARESDASVYDDGRLRVEHDNYYVACGGSALQLPRKEFLILSRLALNAQRVVSSEDIWRHAWPPPAAFNAESLHVHIYRLRRRLAPFRVHIETMINVGYRLVTIAEGGWRQAD